LPPNGRSPSVANCFAFFGHCWTQDGKKREEKRKNRDVPGWEMRLSPRIDLMATDMAGKRLDEMSLVRLYMELTGATEGRARGVLMYVCSENGREMDSTDAPGMEPLQTERPVSLSPSRPLPNTGWRLDSAVEMLVPCPAHT
jgi:hypothetical protein